MGGGVTKEHLGKAGLAGCGGRDNEMGTNSIYKN